MFSCRKSYLSCICWPDAEGEADGEQDLVGPALVEPGVVALEAVAAQVAVDLVVKRHDQTQRQQKLDQAGRQGEPVRQSEVAVRVSQ